MKLVRPKNIKYSNCYGMSNLVVAGMEEEVAGEEDMAAEEEAPEAEADPLEAAPEPA
ncbi:hypothetical protein K450DRAFT_237889 [Umbelopsis ramanniana AG]|uniref:Uncharacterized protein n=1 Tax=Umbelopsis ramanniana AG TaxID=1314678 RepID=A0AAD5EBF2_UMBRA|nr:uncharacterized protein K450DRAFT_237889 [Umbelopsis ramanniana AG]KAI8580312.1 hypothetical protein K450DRAFT_237889 [Umbelopsis ramanniana AG]